MHVLRNSRDRGSQRWSQQQGIACRKETVSADKIKPEEKKYQMIYYNCKSTATMSSDYSLLWLGKGNCAFLWER